ncbi:MAG: hypothetical protein BAJALOKI2v1_360011 [Promethearchaeota archaeon]|nr:MAG: hypothetical protein BAJALOKI2v1_360011 [Candidatus Lokiarchaeota archaeon]
MYNIVNKSQVDNFLARIEENFPNFIAGIITDRHGFPIASKIPETFPIQENTLALSAISKKRNFFDDSNYIRVERNLNKSKNIKMFLLLEKKYKYIHRFKQLKNIIMNQNLF